MINIHISLLVREKDIAYLIKDDHYQDYVNGILIIKNG